VKPYYHKKGWGYEMWLHNDEKYCGKLLFFEKGKKCSYHYHKIKHETFYLQSGMILLHFGYGDSIKDAATEILMPGDTFEVLPLLRHQMIAIKESELFEFSTEHFEYDSYRIEKGD
jgi:quercetin dioxygenase-like cupin family protein